MHVLLRTSGGSFQERIDGVGIGRRRPMRLSLLISPQIYGIIPDGSKIWNFVSGRGIPANDGKQTPMKGHPVFIGQHATGTCCRGCLKKMARYREGQGIVR